MSERMTTLARLLANMLKNPALRGQRFCHALMSSSRLEGLLCLLFAVDPLQPLGFGLFHGALGMDALEVNS